MKYSLLMRTLHWLMAVIILFLLFIGFYMHNIPADAPNKLTFYPLHKSLGVLMMLLVLVRLVVRYKSVIPPLPAGLKSWEVKLSSVIHVALYTAMALMPVTGYLMSSTFQYSHGIDFFGLTLPDVLPKSDAMFEFLHSAHNVTGIVFLILLALHIGGALKHRFFESKEHDVINRMI